MIAQCTCKHEAQDKLNGKGNRVFNPTKKKAGDKVIHTCSVCGAAKALE